MSSRCTFQLSLSLLVLCICLGDATFAETVVHPADTRQYPQEHGTLVHRFQVTECNTWLGGTYLSNSLSYRPSWTSEVETITEWTGRWERHDLFAPRIVYSHGLALLDLPIQSQLLVRSPSGQWRVFRFTEGELAEHSAWVQDQTDWDRSHRIDQVIVRAVDSNAPSVLVEILSGYVRTLEFTINHADGTLSLAKLNRIRRRSIQKPLPDVANYSSWIFAGAVGAAIVLLGVLLLSITRGEQSPGHVRK
ncbi:MAG: hypothetical protein AAB393_06940 [Bacteroidota bacterium]